MLHTISKARFDALASYCRDPRGAAFATELAWLEAADGQILATLIVDTDNEFSAIVLARDLAERFRWIDMTSFFGTPEEAVVALRGKVSELVTNLDDVRVQGDESNKIVDFFKPLTTGEKLHTRFRELTSSEAFSPAREIISSMMRWYEDIDGNFVEQFQTVGFDARIWELYLLLP